MSLCRRLRYNSEMIYLDNNATTQLHPDVLDAMLPYLHEEYGNPSSVHPMGQQARQAVEEARRQTAILVGCRATELIFTSGGTEADNAAILGVLSSRPDKKTIITSAVEHSAVRETLQQATKNGWLVKEIPVNSEGRLDLAALKDALQNPDVALASIMWANNETGVLFDISAIGVMARQFAVPLHVDAVQVAGKLPLRFSHLPVDLMTLSAHKFHGPKGVGALIVRRGVRWQPLIRGGPQETDRRGGTENVAGIVGMGAAAVHAAGWLNDLRNAQKITRLRDSLERGILSAIPQTAVNGDQQHRLYNTTNIGFASLEAEAILLLLSQQEICASAGAACSSGSLEPSHVLKAMKIPDRYAHGSIRFSFSEFNTSEDVEQTLAALPGIIEKLRKVLPVA
jgi:cysteine desulfurase